MDKIPLFDARSGGPIAHAKARFDAVAALREACLAFAPRWSHVCLTPIDRVATGWLRRSASAYVAELEHIAAWLGFPGAVALNLSYLFACTTSAAPKTGGAPLLRRSLDWPFHGLGRGVEVVLQAGPAGEFYNVTWPGAVGVLTAMAPGRFCAVINQAPMRRRTASVFGLPLDVAANLTHALIHEDGWPPDHLLRLAFETCATFEEAIDLLSRETLARPALFTLTGTAPGEMAVVERTERAGRVIRGPVVVANDWQTPQIGWAARMGYANNEARKRVLRETPTEAPPFAWVAPPVLNHTTRLVVEMHAGDLGELCVRGYELNESGALPTPATGDFRLKTAA